MPVFTDTVLRKNCRKWHVDKIEDIILFTIIFVINVKALVSGMVEILTAIKSP